MAGTGNLCSIWQTSATRAQDTYIFCIYNMQYDCCTIYLPWPDPRVTAFRRYELMCALTNLIERGGVKPTANEKVVYVSHIKCASPPPAPCSRIDRSYLFSA